MSEEREIDLIDLVIEVLKHWKGAIVFMLIGAVCLGAYSYMRPAKSAADEPLSYADTKAVDVALEYEDLYLQAKEKNDIEMLIDLNKAVIDSVKSFSDGQLKYFAENSKSDLWKSEEAAEVLEEAAPSRGISKKLTAIGAIGFLFIYFCIWAVLYVLDNCVKVSDDMVSLVNVAQVGKICTIKEPAFFIDKILYRMKHHGQRVFDADKSVELMASNLAVNAKKKDISAITIVGCDLEKKAKEYCIRIADILKTNHQIDANVLDDIVYNQEAVEALGNSQSVVLVETVGNTLYADLDKEVKLIRQLDIPILGGITVE